jgi:hypothetical protein
MTTRRYKLTDEDLSKKRAAAGRKGGKATGRQKSWIAKLPPEERSKRMKAIRKGK